MKYNYFLPTTYYHLLSRVINYKNTLVKSSMEHMLLQIAGAFALPAEIALQVAGTNPPQEQIALQPAGPFTPPEENVLQAAGVFTPIEC
jgi:hypothetical protein